MSAYSYSDLARHAGHKIECVIYAGVNAAVECMNCNEVLLDFEKADECEACNGTGLWNDGLGANDGSVECPDCEGTGLREDN